MSLRPAVDYKITLKCALAASKSNFASSAMFFGKASWELFLPRAFLYKMLETTGTPYLFEWLSGTRPKPLKPFQSFSQFLVGQNVVYKTALVSLTSIKYIKTKKKIMLTVLLNF